MCMHIYICVCVCVCRERRIEGLMRIRRGERGKLAMVVIILVMMSLVWLTTTAAAKTTLHKVGGSLGWNQDLNYTLWSSSQHIFVGDWLYFHFDKRYYNVLEVNRTSYENCIDKGFIKNITRGGRDVYELTEARPYYFLSGGGYCYHGMRVPVFVDVRHSAAVPAPSPAAAAAAAPAPDHNSVVALAPAQNASPISITCPVDKMFLYVVLSVTLIFFILF